VKITTDHSRSSYGIPVILDPITGRPIEYLPIAGSDSVMVGSDGTWFSARNGIWHGHRTPKGPYYVVALVDGKPVYLHRLILTTFLGPAPPGRPFALHNDDNPSNNRLDNLRWGSSSDNGRDQARNLSIRRAIKPPRYGYKPRPVAALPPHSSPLYFAEAAPCPNPPASSPSRPPRSTAAP
jgi:hypothetical protein